MRPPTSADVEQTRRDLESGERMLRWFRFEHLPGVLAAVSREFCRVAITCVQTIPRSAERTIALRKLLEAKDAAVRASLPEDA